MMVDSKIIKLLWLFLYAFTNVICIGTSFDYKEIMCTPNGELQTHSVPENTIIHFSANIAKNWLKTSWSYSNQSSNTCNEKFIATKNNLKLFAVIFNGDDHWFKFRDEEMIPTSNSYFFSNTNIMYFMAGKALEGIVFSYDPTTAENSCPFSNNVIEMKEGQIIPIFSSFNFSDKHQRCAWKFSINHETQKLKVLKSNSALETRRRAITNFTQCFNQISSKIFGEKEVSTFQNTGEEYCIDFISVVKKHPKYKIIECKHKRINDSIIQVSNSDDGNGYGPYEKCEYVINIPKNHVISITENYAYIELENDKLLLEETSGKQLNVSTNMILNENANGTILKFQSDGNIQKLGFNFTLHKIKKQCSKSQIIIPCDNKQSKTFTPLVVPFKWHLYKGMECNFTFQLSKECNAYSYSLKIFGHGITFNKEEKVLFQIFTNGNFRKNIEPKEKKRVDPNVSIWFINFKEQFSSSEILTLRLVIPESIENIYPSGYLEISASSNGPLITLPTIYLNKTYNVYPIILNDIKTNTLITVCVQEANDELEIFSATAFKYDNYGFYLYDSAEKNNVTMKLDESSIPLSEVLRYKKSSSGCFTLHRYIMTEVSGKVLFKLIQSKTNNHFCNNFHNVFVLSPYNENITLYNNASNTCEIFLIFLSDRNMKWLTTFNTSKNSYMIFQNLTEKQEFFKISSEDGFEWNEVQLSTQFLSIIMSPMSKLSFTAEIRWTKIFKIEKPTKSLFYASNMTYLNPHMIMTKPEFNISFSYKYGNASCPWKIVAFSNETESTFILNLNSNGFAIGYLFVVENVCNDEKHPNIYIEYFAQRMTPKKESFSDIKPRNSHHDKLNINTDAFAILE